MVRPTYNGIFDFVERILMVGPTQDFEQMNSPGLANILVISEIHANYVILTTKSVYYYLTFPIVISQFSTLWNQRNITIVAMGSKYLLRPRFSLNTIDSFSPIIFHWIFDMGTDIIVRNMTFVIYICYTSRYLIMQK